MKILVIGDSCTDVFIYGYTKRLCPEGPVPILEPSRTITNQGMAGNVVANLQSLKVEKVELVTNKEQITKTRYVEEKSNALLLRIDSNDKVSNSFDVKRVPFSDYDAVIVSDYDKGFLTYNDIEEISKSHPLTFIDTKKPLTKQMSGYSFIKINEVEWEECKDAVRAEFPAALAIFLLVMVWAKLMSALRMGPARIREGLGLGIDYVRSWKSPEWLVYPTIVCGCLS